MENLNIIAPICYTGYGIVGAKVVSALSKYFKVSLFPQGKPEWHDKEDIPAINNALANARFFDPNAPCIKIWHQFDMAQFVGRGMHIGWPIFELNAFSGVEHHHLSSCDELFVCSQWAKNVLNDSGIGRSMVVPLGVDTTIFTPSNKKHNGKTIFLNIGKWEVRKGHLELVQAFNHAFRPEDDVELWLMCDNPFYTQEQNEWWQNLYKSSKLGDKIRFIPRVLTQREVARIMSMADVGVFPALAEGWNLELLEMMALGKRVIATEYAGHTEFCDNNNCDLVPVDKLKPAIDACELHPFGFWFKGAGTSFSPYPVYNLATNGKGKWASLDGEAMAYLVEFMVFAHTSSQRINTKGIETANKFSWDNTALTIKKHLENIGCYH